MKVDQFLTLRDYFNYYVAGVVWWIDFGLIALLAGLKPPIAEWAKALGEGGGILGLVVGGVVVLVIPYVTGFALFPLGTIIRKLWQGGKQRDLRPDPRKGVLAYQDSPVSTLDGEASRSKTEEPPFKLHRIPQKEVKRIRELAGELFGFKYIRDVHLYFYPIRAYTDEYGGNANKLAVRAWDLVNFIESLLIPVPLAVFLLGLFFNYSVYQVHGSKFTNAEIYSLVWYASVLAAGILGFFSHILLVNRYFEMEMYMVRHVYRAFLALRSEKAHQQIAKNHEESPIPKIHGDC